MNLGKPNSMSHDYTAESVGFGHAVSRLSGCGKVFSSSWSAPLSSWALAMTGVLSLSLAAHAQTNQLIQSRRLDYHLAEQKFRAMTLRDENGKIPPNALINAVQQK